MRWTEGKERPADVTLKSTLTTFASLAQAWASRSSISTPYRPPQYRESSTTQLGPRLRSSTHRRRRSAERCLSGRVSNNQERVEQRREIQLWRRLLTLWRA